MTINTPTKAPEITLYRVFYLVEAEEQDYELLLYTDNKEYAWGEELLSRRLEEIPELKNELNELGTEVLDTTTHNYCEEFWDTKKEYTNSYSQDYSIYEKEYHD